MKIDCADCGKQVPEEKAVVVFVNRDTRCRFCPDCARKPEWAK